MPNQVEQILETRQRQVSGRRGVFLVTSAVVHGGLIAILWLGPKVLAKAPEPLKFVEVSVVPLSRLGSETPPPPPPPKPVEEAKEEAPPPPPPPEPEVKLKPPPPPDDRPVLAQEKKKPKSAPPPAPEPANPIAAPTPQRQTDEPVQRRGSATGNPLGTSVHKNRLGIEDPNFTYGYYLDLVVTALRDTWSRPAVGSEFKQAIVHFRILREGAITEVRLMETSGSQVFDRAALSAVNNATLPPLPRGYKEDDLGINVIIR